MKLVNGINTTEIIGRKKYLKVDVFQLFFKLSESDTYTTCPNLGYSLRGNKESGIMK